MPYDLFWHGPLSAFFQYRAAYIMREKENQEQQNRLAWLNGVYVTHAVGVALGGGKYPKEPIKPQKQLTPEEQIKQEEMNAAIIEHNEKMRAIKERKARELQEKLIRKAEVNESGRTDY